MITFLFFRTGLIRVGDRLLKVDNHSLINKTLLEAQQILKENTHGIILTTLTIEYDVSVMESVKYATGPLLLEIDRQVEEDFGLVLTNSCDMNPDDIIAGEFLPFWNMGYFQIKMNLQWKFSIMK